MENSTYNLDKNCYKYSRSKVKLKLFRTMAFRVAQYKHLFYFHCIVHASDGLSPPPPFISMFLCATSNCKKHPICHFSSGWSQLKRSNSPYWSTQFLATDVFGTCRHSLDKRAKTPATIMLISTDYCIIRRKIRSGYELYFFKI